MRRLPLATTAIFLVALAPAASADTLKRWTIRDRGTHIIWGVTVCTKKPTTIKQLKIHLEPDDGGIRHSEAFSGGRNPAGCSRWTGRFRDIYATDLWYATVRVALANGRALRSPGRTFFID